MIRFRDFIKLDLEQLATLRARPSIDDPQPQEASTGSNSPQILRLETGKDPRSDDNVCLTEKTRDG